MLFQIIGVNLVYLHSQYEIPFFLCHAKKKKLHFHHDLFIYEINIDTHLNPTLETGSFN